MVNLDTNQQVLQKRKMRTAWVLVAIVIVFFIGVFIRHLQ